MLKVLANRAYRHLFLAQVIALVGTGLATVALGLIAFDLAGANAGAVLGRRWPSRWSPMSGWRQSRRRLRNILIGALCWSAWISCERRWPCCCRS